MGGLAQPAGRYGAAARKSPWRPPKITSSSTPCGGAHIKGALVGVESVTPEGLKDVYKGFNASGEKLVERLQRVPQAAASTCSVRSSSGCRATGARRSTTTPVGGPACRRHLRAVRDADAVSGHARLRGVGEVAGRRHRPVSAGSRPTRHWLIPQAPAAQVYTPHPLMTARTTSGAPRRTCDRVLRGCASIWAAVEGCVRSLKARLAFVLISKLYRQMGANTGIATDSARVDTLGALGPPAGLGPAGHSLRRPPDARSAAALTGGAPAHPARPLLRGRRGGQFDRLGRHRALHLLRGDHDAQASRDVARREAIPCRARSSCPS